MTDNFAMSIGGVGRGRIIILGAPRTGKSTLQAAMAEDHPELVRLCTDPAGDVKEPLAGVEYVPDDCEQIQTFGKWSGASQYVADVFLERPGPWVLEGVGAARALRKWKGAHLGEKPPCDLLLWLKNRPWVKHSRGQAAMSKGIHAVMRGLQLWLSPVMREMWLEEDDDELR